MLTELAENRGFTGGVNVGLERSSGDFVAFVNNDATLESGALGELLRVGETGPDIGSVAAQMRFADRPETINSPASASTGSGSRTTACSARR